MLNSESDNGGYPLNWQDDDMLIRGSVLIKVAEKPQPISFQEGRKVSAETNSAVTLHHNGRLSREERAENGTCIAVETFRPDNGLFVAVRVEIANRNSESLTLDQATLLNIDSAARISPGRNLPFSQWQVTRMARQKNDIPGRFRPAVPDYDFQDACFESGEVIAGQGVGTDSSSLGAAGENDDATKTIVADPCLLIRGADRSHGLFLAMMGQNEHLTTLSLQFRHQPEPEFVRLTVDAEFDRVILAPGGKRISHWLLIGKFSEESSLLDWYADLYARYHRVDPPPAAKPSIYASWYFYGSLFGAAELEENLAELQRRPVPFDVLLIDNSWDNDFGSWMPNERWPGGMKKAAERIRAAGYEPGIWTAPFVVMAHSPIMEQYPELVARDINGEPCRFGYQGPKCYVVDVTAPAAEEYFQELYQRLRNWGYRYHKFDFLRAVFNAPNITFFDSSKTRAQAYRHGLTLLRRALGEDAYIIACGGLFEGSAGLVNAVRTGSDTVGSWSRKGYSENRPTCAITAKQNLFRSYTNRLWHTDPDAVMLRLRQQPLDPGKPHLSIGTLTDEEAFTLIAVQFLSGGAACFAERFSELSDSRHAMLRHLLPQLAPPAQPLDWHHPECPSLFVSRIEAPATSLPEWHILTVINWEDKTLKRTFTLDFPAAEQGRYAVFEFSRQQFLGLFETGQEITLELEPHATRLLRLAAWPGDRAVVLGTDSHITGGACELRNVKCTGTTVSGRIETPWTQYPVQVTAAFPHNGEAAVGKVTAGNGTDFIIKPERTSGG